MSKSEVCAPVSSAPADRLALGLGWARPEVAVIGGTLNPAYSGQACYGCFESSEE